MELEKKHYYRLVFNNGQELFVHDDEVDVEKFISKLTDRGFFSKDIGYVSVKLTGATEPLYIREGQIFSVQKCNEGIIGTLTKIWILI